MDVISSIMVTGVAIVAIAVLTYATGSVMLNLPTFGTAAYGGSGAADFRQMAWNTTMANISSNSQNAFQLTSISPLILGAALIISILLGVFVYTKMQQ